MHLIQPCASGGAFILLQVGGGTNLGMEDLTKTLTNYKPNTAAEYSNGTTRA